MGRRIDGRWSDERRDSTSSGGRCIPAVSALPDLVLHGAISLGRAPRNAGRLLTLAALLAFLLLALGEAPRAHAQSPEESEPVPPAMKTEDLADKDIPAETAEPSRDSNDGGAGREDQKKAEEPAAEKEPSEAEKSASAEAVTAGVFEELSGDAPGAPKAPPPPEPTEVPEAAPEIEQKEVLATQESPDTKPEEEAAEEAPAIVPPPPEPEPEEGAPEEAALPSEEAPPAIDPSVRRVWWDNGLRIERNDKLFRMKFGGRLLIDAANTFGNSTIERLFDHGSEGDIRQARLDLTGTFRKRTYYQLAVDLTGQSSSEDDIQKYLTNAFVGMVGPRFVGRVEGGIIREPISMGALTSRLNISFLERALPDAFVAGYQPGVVLRNDVLDNRLHWAVGVFRFRGSSGNNSDRMDITGRISGIPWLSKDGTRFLHLGVSYDLMIDNSFKLRINQRPETWFGDNWVDTGQFNADSAHVVSGEFAGIWRSMAFQSEVLINRADREHGSSVQFWGAYAQISYFLTGQHRHYQRRHGIFGPLPITQPVSFEPFTPGAWELTARFSHLDLNDEEIRGGILNTFTLGINWYILHNLRLMANYTHANLNGVGQGNVMAGRFQISY